jgi:uncharacterized membrane protein YpjA
LRRLFAYVIDTIVHTAIAVGALAAVVWNQKMDLQLFSNTGVILVSAVFLVCFHWTLLAAQEIAFHTSFGKRMMGLAIPGGALSNWYCPGSWR